MTMSAQRRLAFVYELCRKRRHLPEAAEHETQKMCTANGQLKVPKCLRCGRFQPRLRRSGMEVAAEWKSPDSEAKECRTFTLSPERVLEIFKGISDNNCEALGMDPKFARPDWLILQVLPVAPPCLCLSEGNNQQDDDLTLKLVEIIKSNNRLKRSIEKGAVENVLSKDFKRLQGHVGSLFDNQVSATKKSRRTLKPVKQKLITNGDRIRDDLMTKQENYSARTVITPDPNLSIDQVGVPIAIAQSLTFPEIVSPWNLDFLRELVKRGPSKYPGANSFIKEDGFRLDLCKQQENQTDIGLQLGDKVERHMLDGDPVVMNHLPAVHKMSMMCHRAKVLPWSTFRLNLSVTTPYNAAFDGEEMTLHMPQSYETRAEIQDLALVSKLIIGPQANRPVMGIVQDSLTAAYKMTARDVFIEKEDVMNLLLQIPSWNGVLPQPAILKPKPLWTGKQLLSVTIPDRVNFTRTSMAHSCDEDRGPYKWLSSSDTKVLIDSGELISGILDKRSLGASSGSLMHVVALECNHKEAAEFYSSLQTLVNNWLLIEGHTIGIADLIIDRRIQDEIHKAFQSSKHDLIEVAQKAYGGELEATNGTTLRQTFENHANRILGCVRYETGGLVNRSLSEFNNFKTMIISGAKGSSINISQVMAMIGQQCVEGQRIPFGFQKRTLPHFFRDDHSPNCRGFVENSYLTGLTPAEFFFHAMGGREGLVDTSLKRVEFGNIQQKLFKALANVTVEYDGTVRNHLDQLIQFRYGDDGLEATRLEFQDLVSLKASNKAFEEQFRLKTHDKSSCLLLRPEADAEFQQLSKDRQELRQLFKSNNQRAVLPCNIERLVWNAQKQFLCHPTDLNPLHAIQSVRELCKKLVSHRSANEENLLIGAHLRSTLCSTKVCNAYRLSSKAFDWLIGEVETQFHKCLVNPGEMVGLAAAQSVSEPSAEMTLAAFYYSGVSAKKVTLGIPRLKEIINVQKHLKTPSMTVFLSGQAARDAEQAKDVLLRLEHVTLRQVIVSTAIYYDPDPKNSIIPEDREFVSIDYELSETDFSKLSPWLLRIQLDREQMKNKKLTLEQISYKIKQAFGDNLNCIFSDDNAEKLILRIRATLDVFDNDGGQVMLESKDDYTLLRYIEATLVSDLTVKGIEDVSKVYMGLPKVESKKRIIETDAGELKVIAEWLLETEGTALKEVLNDRDIDEARTVSNDVSEICSVLGIEAARKVLQNELNEVLLFDGTYINCRHLALLCEVMTINGQVTPLTRHNINRQSVSALARCSFDAFLDAAYHGQEDPLRGVPESIVTGQLGRFGTGTFDLLAK